MNTKNILIWVGGIVATFILLFVVYKITASPQKIDFSEINQVRSTDNIKWSTSKDSNILVEYSDLQCPACKSFHDVLKTFEASNSPDLAITKKTTLVFRHFPLYQIHKNAYLSAYAAESAGLQNKYWEMVDVLFNKQTEWSPLSDPKEYFVTLAKSLELDVDKFKNDMDSENVKNKVQADLTEGESIGINSTPTFFLNGKKVNVNTFDEFKNLLKSL